ncbi:MAG: hypothetical protein SOY54_07890 [Bacilli bacterium]|nr:hypothetical protein [Bacilli bacterium]
MKRMSESIKKILGLFAIVLGCIICCSCTMPNTTNTAETPSNIIRWISDNNRAATITSTFATDTIDYVTIEIYKVPNRNGKFIHEEKELLETRKLYRGEVVTVSSSEDYDYKYISCINVIKFNWYSAFYAERNEINFFDYEGTIGMEISNFYNNQLDNLDDKGWKSNSFSVSFRDPVEGYYITYNFLDQSVAQKFYEEHKDRGRIIWK